MDTNKIVKMKYLPYSDKFKTSLKIILIILNDFHGKIIEILLTLSIFFYKMKIDNIPKVAFCL